PAASSRPHAPANQTARVALALAMERAPGVGADRSTSGIWLEPRRARRGARARGESAKGMARDLGRCPKARGKSAGPTWRWTAAHSSGRGLEVGPDREVNSITASRRAQGQFLHRARICAWHFAVAELRKPAPNSVQPLPPIPHEVAEHV